MKKLFLLTVLMLLGLMMTACSTGSVPTPTVQPTKVAATSIVTRAPTATPQPTPQPTEITEDACIPYESRHKGLYTVKCVIGKKGQYVTELWFAGKDGYIYETTFDNYDDYSDGTVVLLTINSPYEDGSFNKFKHVERITVRDYSVSTDELMATYRAEYKAKCEKIPCKSIIRNSAKDGQYAGKYVTFSGRIIQAVNDNTYLLDTGEDNGIVQLFWQNLMGNTKILATDNVTVYGQLGFNYQAGTYESLLGTRDCVHLSPVFIDIEE